MCKTILDLLKSHDARVTYGNKWLVYNDGVFVVYGRKPYQKYTRIFIETEKEVEAINALCER